MIKQGLIFFFAVCAWGQVERPAIGWMLDSSGAVRPVFGVSASVTLGDPVATGVVSMSCGRKRCLTRSDAAVVAFGGGAVYVYSAGQLSRSMAEKSEPVSLDVSGEVLSMRVTDGVVECAVRRDDGTWIVRDGDTAIGAIPNATGPVMLLDAEILYASGDETVLRRADGSEVRFPIHADAFFAMGPQYVQIRSGESNYALRIASGREKFFMLPEVQ